VRIGPVFVHAYGLMYVLAVLAAIALTRWLWESRGGRRELVYEVAMVGFPCGLIGGRIYFLVTSWNEVPPHWWGPLAIWQGGLGIWGGIAGGVAGGLWVLRRRQADVPAFMDAAAPGLLVAQAIGRIGNWFNQELFGGPTSLPWGLRIAPDHRPSGYIQYPTFHPTFLYELIWNLLLASVLIWLWRRRTIRAPGIFALYVAGYSLARIGEELLRVDPAHHVLGMRLNFWVACALFLVGLAWFARIQWGWRQAPRVAALLAGAVLLSQTGCGSGQNQTSPTGATVAPVHSASFLASTSKMVLPSPPAAHTRPSSISAWSITTGSPWEKGGTPPGEKPVAARTSSALAGRASAQSSTRHSASASIRRAPLATTTTGSPSAMKTIDFAI
jgi:prolipoprotein diacylglyceryl transferase